MYKGKIIDRGVYRESSINVFLASPFSRESLFHLLYSGEYICNTDYKIQRDFRDMFLIMMVEEGVLEIQYEGGVELANKNDVVLLDCKKPHLYKANTDKTEFKWFHFNGNISQQYFDIIYKEYGSVIKEVSQATLNKIGTIVEQMKKPILDEHIISAIIHMILGELFTESATPNLPEDSYIRQAMTFVHENYAKDISVEVMADSVNLSPYYFIKLFKRKSGLTPHEYLTNVRLKKAQELLLNTNKPIEEIAEECGFNSASHFSRRFKASTEMTPGSFRKTIF